MSHDDMELLVRTGRGDEAAAVALWERHGPALVAYAGAILGPARRHQADDVVQEVMCSILRSPASSLRQVRDARVWLSTITRRVCLNTLRTAGRHARLAASSAALGEQRTTNLVRLASFDRQDILEAIDALPRKLREVLYLRHVSCMTFDQMAASLAGRRGTLSDRYHEAIERLRATLDRHNPSSVSDGSPTPRQAGAWA